MIYDTAIIGAGACGAATAWQLSHTESKTILLEKETDAAFGVSKANSGIVHGGFHHPSDTLKTKLELRGNKLFDVLHKELGFPYHKCGILVAAYSEEQMETVKKLYQRGLDNGVTNLELCDRARMLELEPKLNDAVCGGFFAPDGGTIEPYGYVFSLVESAIKNGVDVSYNFKVCNGKYENGVWTLTSADGRTVQAKYVVNAAGLYADEISRVCGGEEFRIIPRKGEEYLLDKTCACRPEHVLFPVPTKHSKGVLVIPTAGGTTMIGPTADPVESKDDTETTSSHLKRIAGLVSDMINGVSLRDLITSFAGLRPVLETEDFYIEPSKRIPAFIQVAGIQSPGLTASPAIGEYVVELLKKEGLELKAKTADRVKNYKIDPADPAWNRIVCRCEKISEAEIVEAIRKGHTTVDGIKFHTRSGMGRCQGGFCAVEILKIISRETGMSVEELTKRGGGSRIIAGKLGSLEVKA